MNRKRRQLAPFPSLPTRWLVSRTPDRLSWALSVFQQRESLMEPAGRRPVVDVAWSDRTMVHQSAVDRAKVLQRLRISDTGFRLLTRLAAIAVLVILSGIIFSLVWGSSLALSKF